MAIELSQYCTSEALLPNLSPVTVSSDSQRLGNSRFNALYLLLPVRPAKAVWEHWPLGTGLRYVIYVTHFRTMCEPQTYAHSIINCTRFPYAHRCFHAGDEIFYLGPMPTAPRLGHFFCSQNLCMTALVMTKWLAWAQTRTWVTRTWTLPPDLWVVQVLSP